MQAQIIGIAQELSFTDGVTASYMVVQLSNGQEIRAIVNSDAAATITSLFIQAGGTAAEQALAEANSTPTVDPAPPRTTTAQQPHPALSQAGANGGARAREGNYTPLKLDDDGNAEFGGDFQSGMDDELDNGPTTDEYDHSMSELASVEENLQKASALLSVATGIPVEDMDPEALRRAVVALQLPVAVQSMLPQPVWSRPVAVASPRQPRQALQVQADGKGNPIFHGTNVADVRDLAGGNMDGEPADEVGSV